MKMTQKTRNKNGFESDRILLEAIKDYSGLSQYELAKKLKWPSGRVDGAVRRLLNEGLIVIKTLERNGRRVNLVYPEDSKPTNVVEVPEKLLHVGNPTWLDSAFIYALDSTTIGISGHEMPEWAEISCFLKQIPIKRDNDKVVLEIPENFKRFYNMDKKHRVVTINGNNLLITISGNLIEEKKYPS
jgi:DNA-binding Lrp family transcriptional regulator